LSEQRQVLYEGKFLRLVRQGRWEYAERTNSRDAVCIVAVTPAGELLLVEQFRMPVGEPVIELPAGLVGDEHAGEDYPTAATRELHEETGYKAGTMRKLFGGPPTAGMASERIFFYRAEALSRAGNGGGNETEQITVHAIPLAEVEAWLRSRADEGAQVDPKVYAGLFALRHELSA
jgi:ADP-ribose pyrophosphatase